MLALPFDSVVQIELGVIIEQIRSLNKSIPELEKTIADEGSKLEGHKSLISIKGIGTITSAILLSVIGEVSDFPDESRLSSYFGIVPRVAKVLAAQRSTSISGLLAQQIELLVDSKEAYERSQRAALAFLEKGFHLGGMITASPDELHER